MALSDVYLGGREWRGIRFDEDGIVADGVLISRNSIRHISLRHGRRRGFWLLELIVGLAIALASLFPLCQFLLWLVRGEVLSTAIVFLGAGVVIGAGLMFDALKTDYYLDVQTAEGRERVPFSGAVDVRQLEQFLESVEQQLEYEIERKVVTSGFPVSEVAAVKTEESSLRK